jgi:xylan 1,4-beta-xylosidase
MTTKALAFLPLITTVFAAGWVVKHDPDSFPVTITVDAGKSEGKLKPIWRFFGADEPNYATMPNGEKLISELGGLKRGAVYFRAHNMLTSGDGNPSLKWGSTNLYSEDASGHAIYDYKIADQIFDTYLKHGVRPYVEIGFMPEALSTHPTPYRHNWSPKDPYDAIYTGWAYPPTSYAKWGEIVFHWAQHCVQRYGKREVEKWYWEVWNEPNIGYWKGTQAEFFRLHDTAIDAVRRALPTARVGGPDNAGGGSFFNDVLDHVTDGTNTVTGTKATPTDFVSFHAKGIPTFVDGHVRMGLSTQLRVMDEGFAHVASHPSLKNTPIVIGESDPDGCAACQGPQLGYRNSAMYASYTAATLPRALELAKRRGVNLEGALTWAFEFEGVDPFAGFRQLASNGVDLPVLNVFRMFSKMKGEQVVATSDCQVPVDAVLQDGVRKSPDVGVWAAREGDQLAVLIWHYHDDDLPGPDANVSLKVSGLPATASQAHVSEYRVDQNHSNAYTAWLRMGSPQKPTPEQTRTLQQASRLSQVASLTPLDHGTGTLTFTLPRQGVSLLVISAN